MNRASVHHSLQTPPGREGFTLTELLVASAIALVVMGAIAQLFSLFGRTMRETQSTADLSSRLRIAVWRLEQDLAGSTARPAPWNDPSSDSGYIELIEGPQRDIDPFVTGSTTASLDGDTDDAILLTTCASGSPFVGRVTISATTRAQVESPLAEVAWFCRPLPASRQPAGGPKLYNLHRRQLLVMGYVGAQPFVSAVVNGASGNTIAVPTPFPSPDHDVSMRRVNVPGIGPRLMPNTMADLTKRENRFMRSGTTAFPHAFAYDATGRVQQAATFEGTTRESEDVILQNVIGFDFRVFDPAAFVITGTNTGSSTDITLLPGDPGPKTFVVSGTTRGAFVDLGWMVGGSTSMVVLPGNTYPPLTWRNTGTTALASTGIRMAATINNAISLATSSTNNLLVNATYDTWSRHYESNGLDDDADGTVDEGTDGVDNNGDGVADNPPEYETSPQYPVPLRGIEVRIRCFDPSTQQVRQITIRHAFQQK